MNGDYSARQFALTQNLSFIKGSYKGRPLNLCDTVNYYKCSLEKIGKSVGIPKMEMPKQDESDAVWQSYCMNDVDVTAAGLDALIAFTRKHELGPWGPSIASLAMKAFRGKFLPAERVGIHDERASLKLERNSYFGGITECNRIGKIKGPIHELDVCSMYPAMCMNSLPVAKVEEQPWAYTPDSLREWLPAGLWVADVTLNTPRNRYPVRSKSGTVFPLGKYRTTLSDPELRQALAAGDVVAVHSAQRYHCEPFLARYMKFFGDLKVKYAGKDEAFWTLTKYYLNSLYGKFGQMTYQWWQWGEDAFQELERIHDLPPGSLEFLGRYDVQCETLEDTLEIEEYGITLEIRDLFGYVEVKIGSEESRDSFPAVASCVTGYARVALRDYQRIAGKRNWFYSDTDSLWVNDRGLENLRNAGVVGTATLGMLEYKKTYDWIEVFGPKDYETPEFTKIKGLKLSKSQLAPDGYYAHPIRVGDKTYYYHRDQEGGYLQTQFPSAMRQISDAKFGGVFVRYVTKHLKREHTKWRVGVNGWTRPLKFPEDNQ